MNFVSCRLNTREMEKLQKYCKSWKTMQALGKKEEGRAGWGRSRGEALQEGKKQLWEGNHHIIPHPEWRHCGLQPCCPRGAWAEKNTHGVDSGSSRVPAEEDSASNKALEVKGSSMRELSEGWLLPACYGNAMERGSHPPVPIPRGGEKKRGTRRKEEGTSKYPLAVESSVGPHPGAGG